MRLERIILIDGYNLLFSDKALRIAFLKDHDAGRCGMLELLNRYVAKNSTRVVVVFDGGRTAEGRLEQPASSRVETVFVEDADRYIRKRVAGAPKPEELTVVSSDQDHVARYARKKGARVTGSGTFMAELRKMDRSDREPEEKPSGETKTGVEYWLKQFGSGGKGDE